MARSKGNDLVLAARLEEARAALNELKTKPVPKREKLKKSEAVLDLKEELRELVQRGYSVEQLAQVLKARGIDVSATLIYRVLAGRHKAETKIGQVNNGVADVMEKANVRVDSPSVAERASAALHVAEENAKATAAPPGRLKLRPDRDVL